MSNRTSLKSQKHVPIAVGTELGRQTRVHHTAYLEAHQIKFVIQRRHRDLAIERLSDLCYFVYVFVKVCREISCDCNADNNDVHTDAAVDGDD